MVKKIAFIGSAGTGKSTLANDVFVQLKKRGESAELVNEWIRYDIHANGPMQTIWEQYRTLHYQRSMEDAVPNKVDWLITDSGTLTPYFYATLYTKTADERQRLCLVDIFKFLIDDLYKKRYEYVFYLPGKHTYSGNIDTLANDGTRYQSIDELKTLDEHMRLVFTKMFKMDNIHELDMPLEQRTEHVLGILLNGKKNTNVPNL